MNSLLVVTLSSLLLALGEDQKIILFYATAGTLVFCGFIFTRFWKRRYQYRPYDTSYTLRLLLPIVVAVFAAMVPLTATFFSRLQIDQQPPGLATASDDRLSRLEAEVAEIATQIGTLEKQLAQVPVTPTHGTGSVQPAALIAIDQRLTQNTEAIHKFEQLLVTDASKLVTLPLMQRDFQAIKDDLGSVKDNVNGLRSLVAETGSQNRWVIGTLALGMLALVVPAVRSLLASTPKKEESKPEHEKA